MFRLKLLAVSAILLGPTGALAQTSSVDSSTDDTTGLQEVVVGGIRESVQKAQDIKRDAPTVVEAITSVDLGEFTDSSVADALGRVPGIQIDKTDGPGDLDGVSSSGDRISIRGLGPQYIETTLNGRPTLSLGNTGFSSGNSGGSRAFNFDTIPSEILSGVMVYKTSNAALSEPGMAGAVDVRTLRPLDYHGQEFSNYFGNVTATDSYDNEAGKWGPRFSGVAGGKFFDGTLGLLASALHSDEKQTEDKLFPYTNFETINVEGPSGAVTPIPNVFVPDQLILQRDQREYVRNTVSLDAQWRPNSEFEANVDFTHSRYDVGGDYPSIFVGINDTYTSLPRVFGPSGIGINNGALVYENTNAIVSGGVGDGEPAGQLTNTNVDVLQDSYLGGLNLRWHTDSSSVDFDYGHSYLLGQSNFRNFYSVNDAAVAAGSSIPSLIYNGTGGGLPTFSLGPQFTDRSLYGPTGYYSQETQYLGKLDSFKLDFETSLFTGVELRAGSSYVQSSHEYLTAQGGPTAPQATSAFFSPGTTFNILGVTGVPVTSFSAACNAAPTVCSLSNFNRGSFVGGFPTNPYGSPTDQLPLGAASDLLRERNLGLYAELDFKTHIAGLGVSGNGGLRAVNIHEDGVGISGVTYLESPDNNVPTPGYPAHNLISSDTYSYWKYLPSFNVTLSPREDTNVRLGVAKTISLPDYGTLTPGYQITSYTNGAPGYVSGLNSSGQSNIHLNPTQAWNFDLTLERYWSYGGAVIASLFYKDITDFINTVTIANATLSGYAGVYQIANEVNSQSGRADGFELGTNQPFTFLPSPWDGLGVQGNYTYVDGHFDADPAAQAPAGGFPGASKNNYNVIGYFDKYGFEARIASTYRSRYVTTLGTSGTSTYTDALQTLDASLSYKINAHLKVMASGSNLTGAVRDIRFEGGSIALYAQRPRTYSLSIKASL
jgi:TonB-dependent receptor